MLYDCTLKGTPDDENHRFFSFPSYLDWPFSAITYSVFLQNADWGSSRTWLLLCLSRNGQIWEKRSHHDKHGAGPARQQSRRQCWPWYLHTWYKGDFPLHGLYCCCNSLFTKQKNLRSKKTSTPPTWLYSIHRQSKQDIRINSHRDFWLLV